MTKLIGGPFNNTPVPGNLQNSIWIVKYLLNGHPWQPANGQYYKNFPKGVTTHGYRKQKSGTFTHAWSRNNDDEP